MSKLGVAAYHYVFKPLNTIGYGNLIRQGPVDTFRAYRGRRQLQRWVNHQLQTPALAYVPTPTSVSLPHLCVAYLAGDSQRDLLVASLISLHRHWPQLPAIRLLSDGALSAPLVESLERSFPTLLVIRDEDQREQVEQCFPRHQFPVLRAVRDQYLHLRKMLDLCTLSAEWILLLDADTLFLAEPRDLLARLGAKSKALYLQDRYDNAYGYPMEALQDLIPTPLLQRINAGLLALPISAIDWQQVEHWLALLSSAHGLNYFVEQALWALILSSIGAAPLAHADYICEPTRLQIRSGTGVFHHYVWPCRYLFYGYGWQATARS